MKQSGFTLIETLVVLAMIGLLSAIGIPALQTYLNKTKVTEGVVMISPVKLAVQEYVMAHGPALSTLNNSSLHLQSEALLKHAKNVESINVLGLDKDKVAITVVFKHQLGRLIWQGSYDSAISAMHWSCLYDPDSKMAQFAPRNCSALS